MNRRRNLLPCLALALCASCSTPERAATNGNASGAPASVSTSPAANSPATTAPATDGARDADAVRVSADEATVAAGSKVEATVRVEIAQGFHVNANPPSNKYLIGTRLDVAPADGVSAGAPVYPPGVMRKFAFEQQPLSVYEGTAVIRLPLAADARAAKGRRTVPVKVEVQPCNDQECFPPRTLDAAIQLTVN
ncbi:MAG TPA: protein-disulfide reductase DsbD domain-containing protein [Pyrinomonadaceae bacterium]|nr:protein-disulfide reductase DsbD domain-containing protein [Pyrinomonadaceae bacterium]